LEIAVWLSSALTDDNLRPSWPAPLLEDFCLDADVGNELLDFLFRFHDSPSLSAGEKRIHLDIVAFKEELFRLPGFGLHVVRLNHQS